MLRIDSTTHHLLNETEPREHYTINENIVRGPNLDCNNTADPSSIGI